MPLLKALSVGLHELQAELVDARRSGWPTEADPIQAFLERADELIRNNRQITTRKTANELSVYKEVWTTLTPLYIQNCVLDGFHEAWPTITKLGGKRGAQIYSPVTMLVVKAFCHGSSLKMEHDIITLNGRQKDSQ